MAIVYLSRNAFDWVLRTCEWDSVCTVSLSNSKSFQHHSRLPSLSPSLPPPSLQPMTTMTQAPTVQNSWSPPTSKRYPAIILKLPYSPQYGNLQHTHKCFSQSSKQRGGRIEKTTTSKGLMHSNDYIKENWATIPRSRAELVIVCVSRGIYSPTACRWWVNWGELWAARSHYFSSES